MCSGIDHVMDMPFNDPQSPIPLTYGDIFLQTEQEYSRHNFDQADTDMLFQHFRNAEAECERILAADETDKAAGAASSWPTPPMINASRQATSSTCSTPAAHFGDRAAGLYRSCEGVGQEMRGRLRDDAGRAVGMTLYKPASAYQRFLARLESWQNGIGFSARAQAAPRLGAADHGRLRGRLARLGPNTIS